ncbi:M57 family metalloprotease [Microscilla marina]|nr:M57 family metalloprotease [Microscilla marina]
MKKLNLLHSLFLMVLAAFTFSCKQQETTPNQSQKQGLSQEVVDKFASLGFDARDGVYGQVTNPLTGKTQTGYTLEKDVFISDDQLKSMLASPKTKGPKGEQYRTFSLVNAPRTIRVIGYTGGGGYGLGNTLRTALQQAIQRYNAAGISLRYTLAFGTNFNAYDIVVYQVPNNQVGAQAGFPSGGAPYKWVQMNSGVNNAGLQTARHITMHELGHCIGFRHTDWFNRSISCGQGGSEGQGFDGAINIPGTPTSYDAQSIMLSCGGLGTPGEFSYYDNVSLNYMY